MRRTLKWWSAFLGIVAFPFVLVPLSYQAAMAIPGVIPSAAWEVFASLVFVTSILPVGFLLGRAEMHWMARALAGTVATSMLLVAALVLQIHSTCQPSPRYIGQADSTWRDSECGD